MCLLLEGKDESEQFYESGVWSECSWVEAMAKVLGWISGEMWKSHSAWDVGPVVETLASHIPGQFPLLVSC